MFRSIVGKYIVSLSHYRVCVCVCVCVRESDINNAFQNPLQEYGQCFPIVNIYPDIAVSVL